LLNTFDIVSAETQMNEWQIYMKVIKDESAEEVLLSFPA